MFPKFDMSLSIASQFAARGFRLDAGETANFARELEWLQAQAIEIKYPEYKGLSLVPIVGGGIPLGARSHTYRTVEDFGEAEMLETMASEDFPSVDVQGKEATGTFRSLGAKWSVTVEDLRASQMMSIQVEPRKAMAARKAIEGKLDRLVAAGGGPFTGLFADANSTEITPVAKAADDDTWGAASTEPVPVADDVKKMVDTAFADTKGNFTAYDLVVGTAQWTQLSNRLNTYNDKSIFDYLLSSVPMLRSITHWNRCDGAGTGGKDRILCYPRDPEVLDLLLPIRFEQFAPQLSGMAFVTHCAAKYGGIRFKHVKAITCMDLTPT